MRSSASGGNGSELVDINSLLEQTARELRRRPKWNGGFEAARRIAWDILGDCPVPKENEFDNKALVHRIAEALVEAFDDGVAAEHCAALEPPYREKLLAQLLWHYGIGIATLDEMKTRTTAIARGELKPKPNEPKLWFSSIEALVEALKRLTSEAQSPT